ncbi:MAG: hypothetical protein COA94_08230 [Rickettsiales bacterium]|nr:MAG: hypothetical protein COA94_08230 [Rickettsiales bacterium]
MQIWKTKLNSKSDVLPLAQMAMDSLLQRLLNLSVKCAKLKELLIVQPHGMQIVTVVKWFQELLLAKKLKNSS